MPPVRSDEELMESYEKGFEPAFDELFLRYAPLLRRAFFRNS